MGLGDSMPTDVPDFGAACDGAPSRLPGKDRAGSFPACLCKTCMTPAQLQCCDLILLGSAAGDADRNMILGAPDIPTWLYERAFRPP